MHDEDLVSLIDSRAVIDPSAKLGRNVEVGPYAIIGPDVEIGDDCWIGAHAVVKGPTTMGRENRIHQFASIGEDPQDKKYGGEPTRLEIGDRNLFRECVTVNRGTVQDRGVTTIGNDNWIMAYCHIAHDCAVGNNTVFSNNASIAGHVTIQDHSILAAFSMIHQFCRIGAYSFIGFASGITQDVPPFVMTMGGYDAKPHTINAEGLKRHGFDQDRIRTVRRAYKILYKSGLRLEQARVELEKLGADEPLVKMMADFLRDGKRGIIR